MDSAAVAKLLGHTSTRMVDLVYGHLSDATLAQAVTVLPAPASAPCASASGSKRESQGIR